MGIKISVQMAIMSYLWDVQELTAVASRECKEAAILRLNFVKRLVLTYPDTSVEVEEEELNEIWRKVAKDYGSTK